MRFPDEVLMAYVDGELDAPTRESVDAAVASDRELAARIERQRTLRRAVHAAYEPVLDEPMPQRLLDLASGAGATPGPAGRDVLAGDARGRWIPWPRHWTWLEWGAMTASVAIGVLAGSALLGVQRDDAEVAGRRPDLLVGGASLRAGGALARVLSEHLAATQSPAAPVKVGLSFVTKTGEYCRTFVLEGESDAGSLGGLACRIGSEWRLEVIARDGRPAAQGEFRSAAAGVPQAVMRAIEERIEGSTLDAQAEREAQRRGWLR